jgi:hypothetical protein
MMLSFFGPRPDVTPAQLMGVLLVGVPVVASSLRALGVYDLSKDRQQALRDAGQWGAISAVGLFLSDAGLRAARNYADAQVQAASLTPVPSPAQGGLADASVEPPVVGEAAGEGVVDDQESALLEELDAGLLLTDAGVSVDDEEGALLEELDAGLLPTDAEEFGEGEEPQTGVTPDDPDAL